MSHVAYKSWWTSGWPTPRSAFEVTVEKLQDRDKLTVTHFKLLNEKVDPLPPRQTVVFLVWEACEHQTSDHGSSHRRSTRKVEWETESNARSRTKIEKEIEVEIRHQN
ncbi:hypothetical protein EVAR_37281_1 [Eumeta japonica]|uniref:Uncharacterized protein n=1 Tax=Eumeta variegata TaxID=151549 RepID=A0A4C1WMS8_EUMVA|nr:hypothetical protein EVAR_37281_1 [Eumeta japonica]